MIHGKQVRMRKFLPKGKGVFLALDHGFSMGPIDGLQDLDGVLRKLRHPDLTGIILNYGAFKNLDQESVGINVPVIVHLSGSGIGVNSRDKFVTHDVIQALRLGADAVSLQVNLGTSTESIQIKEAARIIGQADDMGVPVLLMMYNKGSDGGAHIRPEQIVRLGIELGADMIKIDIGNDFSILDNLPKESRVPVFVAGGEANRTEEGFREFVARCLLHGAAGVSVGRNIFQSQYPESALAGICELVSEHAEK